MTTQDNFDFFVDELLDTAVREFKSTEQYKLLAEKLERMDRDCDRMFTADEKAFATECFELILDVGGREERYVYRKGLRDGIRFLRLLGALE